MDKLIIDVMSDVDDMSDDMSDDVDDMSDVDVMSDVVWLYDCSTTALLAGWFEEWILPDKGGTT